MCSATDYTVTEKLLWWGSSAPQKVCRCDRLTVLIIYRLVEVTSIRLFLLRTKLTKLVDFSVVTGGFIIA